MLLGILDGGTEKGALQRETWTQSALCKYSWGKSSVKISGALGHLKQAAMCSASQQMDR